MDENREEFLRARHQIRNAAPNLGADADVLAAVATSHGLIPLTPELWAELSENAGKRCDEIEAEVRKFLGPPAAAFVRSIRVSEEGGTWRYIAGRCWDEWPQNRGAWWDPPSNQLVGMALCKVAAECYGEDYMREPWN